MMAYAYALLYMYSVPAAALVLTSKRGMRAQPGAQALLCRNGLPPGDLMKFAGGAMGSANAETRAAALALAVQVTLSYSWHLHAG